MVLRYEGSLQNQNINSICHSKAPHRIHSPYLTLGRLQSISRIISHRSCSMENNMDPKWFCTITFRTSIYSKSRTSKSAKEPGSFVRLRLSAVVHGRPPSNASCNYSGHDGCRTEDRVWSRAAQTPMRRACIAICMAVRRPKCRVSAEAEPATELRRTCVHNRAESATTDPLKESELITDIREGIVPFGIVVSGDFDLRRLMFAK